MPKRRTTELYRDMIRQVADRIAFLGLTMQEVDDKSGVPDGYTAKALHPDTKSGRQATFPQLQLIVEALWPRGWHYICVEKKPPRRRGPGRPRLPLDGLPPHPASVRPPKRRARVRGS